ncbi:hypothetical protein KEM54_002478 [Ascosphaera aggregata]|nr:hypothetical protein KEM54_002478 [Ascosphaera aggregata]
MSAYMNLENRRSKRKREAQDAPEGRKARVVKTSNGDFKPPNAADDAGSKEVTAEKSVQNTAEEVTSDDKAPLPLLDEIKAPATEPFTPVNEQLSPGQSCSTSSAEYFVYLHRPRTISKVPVLIPLSPKQTLRESLRNKTVLEFPTIYVLRLPPEKLQENNDYILEKDYVKRIGDAESLNLRGEHLETSAQSPL